MTKAQAADKLCEVDVYPDMLSKKDGVFTARRGFFYRHGKTSQELADKIAKKFKVLDHGETFNPFNGGASVKNSSHFWCKFELKEEAK